MKLQNIQEFIAEGKELSASGLSRKINSVLTSQIESAYHGHKVGGGIDNMHGAEPDEFWFRRKNSASAFSSAEIEKIKEKLGKDVHIRFSGSNIFIKGYSQK